MGIACKCSTILIAALCHSLPAMAALGGSVATLFAGSAQPGAATRLATVNDKYNVYETQTPSGIVVRQYSSLDDFVFAVTWQGPVKPDMKQLLGEYFSQYSEAQSHDQANRRHMRIRAPELILQSDGRMRKFSGKAYLPKKMPAGVSIDELQ